VTSLHMAHQVGGPAQLAGPPQPHAPSIVASWWLHTSVASHERVKQATLMARMLRTLAVMGRGGPANLTSRC